MRQNTP